MKKYKAFASVVSVLFLLAALLLPAFAQAAPTPAEAAKLRFGEKLYVETIAKLIK